MRAHERSWWWAKKKALVLITVTIMLQLQMNRCVGCLETERMGLLQLKSYLNSLLTPHEENILKSWSHDDRSSDCCSWERITCGDAIGGHVVNLSLDELMPYTFDQPQHRSLDLSLLHSFPQLQSLNFSLNWFTHLFDPIHGYISFRRLEKLRTLDLSHNGLNNSVLPFLSAARSLRTLKLGGNNLEGVFPPYEFANMTELRELYLEFNEFTFFSFQGLINLRELDLLDLSGNHINDSEAGNGIRTTKLKNLDLSSNKFADIGQLTGLEHFVELKVLNLAENKFNHTGSIKVFNGMPKLQELDLSENEFTDLGLMFPSSLRVLNLAHNQLSSTLKDLVFPSFLQVLNLRSNGMSLTPKGYSEICRLVYLRELDLSNNSFTSLPRCLGNLSRLRTLRLSDNQLDGNLSFFVAGLPSALEYLSLFHNNFNGSFLFNSLVNQTRLEVFKLSSKEGMIQAQAESSWFPLFQLKMLKLQNFIFGSTIPGFLVHQHDLCFVDLSHNKLTGAFPTWLVQNNSGLETMLVNSNMLTELQLPRLVHGLQYLGIASNMIHGSIQEDIGIIFPKLRYINFSSNHFHGTIPSSVGYMGSLKALDLSSNSLSGRLPKSFLRSCNSLLFLLLSNNQFQGKIFPEHANLTSLSWLALDGNSFNGSLGKGLLSSKNLFFVDTSNNSISGVLPLWIGRLSSLTRLYMRGNQLHGPFPRQLQNLRWLQVIDISYNSFSGAIPRNLDFPFLTELRLQSNKFVGTVPDTLFKVKGLEVLDLRNNNFSGRLFDTIDKRSNLRVFLMRNNSLQSHIPEIICQVLSKVGLLDLSRNKLKGAIPSCLGNMSFGAEKYDGIGPSTHFSFGEIPFPRSWRYRSALNLYGDHEKGYRSTITTIVEFVTKSRYETYEGDIVTVMYGLDLSCNQLSGEIPVEIGDLENIRSLNLSRNHITGSIPDSISKLQNLESLDLSLNRLNGIIPPQLADLNSLGYFNVSYNNLSGEIPTNGHLLTFGETSYIGNAHLCGPPTNTICNLTSASNQAKEDEEGGDVLIDMAWFYWTCGVVYISTFLALFSFLSIDSRWSREWFYRVDLLIHHLRVFKDRFVAK